MREFQNIQQQNDMPLTAVRKSLAWGEITETRHRSEKIRNVREKFSSAYVQMLTPLSPGIQRKIKMSELQSRTF